MRALTVPAVVAVQLIAGYAPPFAPHIDCTEAIDRPVDTSPYRSPQAVHSIIARRSAGLSVVEIGTRNGDGMSCFAVGAHQATAVEISPHYCRRLEARAQRLWASGLNHTFSVVCSDYRAARLDADIFTWWQQHPHLVNLPVLEV